MELSNNNIVRIYNKEASEKANNYLDSNSKEDILKETQKATSVLSTVFSVILISLTIAILYLINKVDNSDVGLVCLVVSICVAIMLILLSMTIYLKIDYKKEEKLFNIALCEIYLDNVAEIRGINKATIEKNENKWYITYKDAFGCNIIKEIKEVVIDNDTDTPKCEMYATESDDRRSTIEIKLTINKEHNI